MGIGIVVRWAPSGLKAVLGRSWTLSRQLACHLAGHRSELRLGPGKLALKCDRCGWKSPGWIVADSRSSLYAKRVSGDGANATPR